MRAFEAVTRLGFAARGVMYAAIGYLALRSGRTEDAGGAMDYLATGAGGFLVAAMAAGFFSYGLWRLLEAWIDSEGRGKDRKAIGARLAGAGSGLVHLGLGIVAVLAALHSKSGGGGGGAPEEGAKMALSLPGGEGLLWIGAAILAAVGIQQFRKALSLKFLKHLKPEAARRSWIPWLGRVGFAARGIVFLVIGWLFVQAARSHSSAAAGGIDDALGSLPRSVQTAVAAGVILFGLFSLTEAVYRKMPATRQ
ncbi:MAG TPA: DUF1206 domain-containing protein [Allosphingosinicella sp.]|nr:DUF1206 domain-containing protein [Allosphingosinicella sp.]